VWVRMAKILQGKSAMVSVITDKNWYALYTRHQHEKTVASLLSSKDFEVFLPLYTSVRRRQDRMATLLLPLFPGYIFVHTGLDRWLQIVTTPGVCTVVGFATGPAAIPVEEIDAVRRLIKNAVSVEPHPFMKCGDHVRVRSGPLAGLEGILVRKRNAFRLVISVELLGRAASVDIDALELESVKPSNTGLDPTGYTGFIGAALSGSRKAAAA
jgi:transcription antitermination factor NusG